MTKPLQGALFRKFRDQIMGVIPARDPSKGLEKSESEARKAKPNKGKTMKMESFLVPPRDGRHHRSVLGVVKVKKRTHDGRAMTSRTTNPEPPTHVFPE